MAQMAKDALGLLCLVFSIVFLNVFCWSGFSREMDVLQNWELSKCMDGRTVSEPLSAVIGIGANDEDVRNRDGSKTINMRCAFLVAPYPCEEERDGECHRYAAEPLIADRGKWPHRIDVEEPGVTCGTKCSEPEWTCSDIGACNAYEKTVRLCISKLRMEPYDCWVNPNDLSGEARAEAPSFPAGWFAGSVVSVMFSLGVCSFYLFLLREGSDSKRDCCAKLVAHAIASACIAVIVVCLVFLVQVVLSVSIDDDGSSAVAKEVTLLDLATSMGIDLNATDAMSGRAEPEVEGSVWWTVGIVAISIVAGCCLVVVPRALCSVLLKEGESAREQAIAGNKCSADAFAVGSMVTLRSGFQGGNKIGGPLKFGDEAMVVKVDNCEPAIQVCFNGEYWFYSTSELKAASAAEDEGAAEGDLTEVASADAFVVGSKVKLRSGVQGGSKIGGPLKFGDEATVVKVDNCEPAIQVCFNGLYWFYSTRELEAASAAEDVGAAEGDLTRGVSDPCGKPTQSKSVFSLASKGNSASANISRKELARSVSAASTLSKKQVIGHAILSSVEGQQQLYKGLNSKLNLLPASKADVAATKYGASDTRDRRIQDWRQEGLVVCPISFKLTEGDPVRVDSNKENVERLCTDGGVMWIDEKGAYLGRDGSVMGTDFVGPGVRVKFSDGHWWSFHPSCLWIRAEKLSPTRKEDLEKRATQVANVA